jgi:Cof subfamily protein (haloacid dehalogenase superfamily)
MSLPDDFATVRLIASDLDGTLLRNDRSVSPHTRAALRAAQNAGMVVVLVSARPPRTLREMAREAGVGGLAICSNGALTYDLDRDAVLQRTDLDAAVLRRLIPALRAALPSASYGFEQGHRFACDPVYAELRGSGLEDGTQIGDALDLCDEPAVKLIVRSPHHTPDELLLAVRAVTGEDVTLTHAGAPFVELSAPGVHKAWALEALCARLGIGAKEVIAFGDMPNDLPMLLWAGYGIAVANAHPDLLAQADAVTLSNEEDGVAVVIERLLAPRVHAARVPERRGPA